MPYANPEDRRLSVARRFGSANAHLRQRQAANASQKCDAVGCTALRYRSTLSRFCAAHRRRQRKSGDANVKALRFPEYEGQLRQARKFLKANNAHPAVEAAIAFFRDTFDRARRKDASLDALNEWSWMALNGADAWEALAIALALFLKAKQDPTRFPFGPAVAHTIGAHLCRRLAGRPKVYRYEGGIEVSRAKAAKSADAAAVGSLVFTTLLPFLLNVDIALKQAEAAQFEMRGTLGEPFDPNKPLRTKKPLPPKVEEALRKAHATNAARGAANRKRRAEEKAAQKLAEKEALRLARVKEVEDMAAERESNAALRGFKWL